MQVSKLVKKRYRIPEKEKIQRWSLNDIKRDSSSVLAETPQIYIVHAVLPFIVEFTYYLKHQRD